LNERATSRRTATLQLLGEVHVKGLVGGEGRHDAKHVQVTPAVVHAESVRTKRVELRDKAQMSGR
jgi:hypothetical protein